MLKQDYIEQMIEQLAGAIARVAGLVKETKLDEAERELDTAWSSIGFRRADAARLDDATLKLLLGEKIALAAKLFEAEAELEAARGNTGAADRLRRRATTTTTVR